MKVIQEYVNTISEELEGAKNYAEKYVYFKAKGDGTKANQYKGMAQAELDHAMINHQFAVQEIEVINKTFSAPDDMRKAWEQAHTKYVEQSAWVKQMLTM